MHVHASFIPCSLTGKQYRKRVCLFAIFELDCLEKKFAKSVSTGVTVACSMVSLKTAFASANFHQAQCSGSCLSLQEPAPVFWAASAIAGFVPGRTGCFCRGDGDSRVRKQLHLGTYLMWNRHHHLNFRLWLCKSLTGKYKALGDGTQAEKGCWLSGS